MKLFISLVLLFGFLNNPTLEEIRKIYPNAANSEATAKELSSKLVNITNDDTKTLVAYKGASIALMSRYAKKAAEKSKGFKEGVKLVEFAVTCEPNKIEIRLIRLSIQENTPKIVQYKKNIKGDKNFLLAHYKEESGSLREYLKNFILQSKSFSETEKQTIK